MKTHTSSSPSNSTLSPPRYAKLKRTSLVKKKLCVPEPK